MLPAVPTSENLRGCPIPFLWNARAMQLGLFKLKGVTPAFSATLSIYRNAPGMETATDILTTATVNRF